MPAKYLFGDMPGRQPRSGKCTSDIRSFTCERTANYLPFSKQQPQLRESNGGSFASYGIGPARRRGGSHWRDCGENEAMAEWVQSADSVRRAKSSLKGRKYSMRQSTRSVALAAVSLAALDGRAGRRAGRRLRVCASRAQPAQGMSFAGAAVRFGRRLLDVLEPGHHHHGAGLAERVTRAAIIPESKITPVYTIPSRPCRARHLRAISAWMRWFRRATPRYQVNDRLWSVSIAAAPFGLVTKPQRNLVWPALFAHTSDLLLRRNADRRLQGQ